MQHTLNFQGCKYIYFSMLPRSETIDIRLISDGKGLVNENSDYGEGLKKMRERSHKLKSDLVVNDSVNDGTEIALKVTLPDSAVRISR